MGRGRSLLPVSPEETRWRDADQKRNPATSSLKQRSFLFYSSGSGSFITIPISRHESKTPCGLTDLLQLPFRPSRNQKSPSPNRNRASSRHQNRSSRRPAQRMSPTRSRNRRNGMFVQGTSDRSAPELRLRAVAHDRPSCRPARPGMRIRHAPELSPPVQGKV